MEIAPAIHLISGTVGPRPLQLFLLCGSRRRVLLDTGCAPDPGKIIFPYLHSIGLDASGIDLVINTHCDMDHCGGNYAVKLANPRVQITCGEKDRALIEDPAKMWELRYNAYEKDHGIHYKQEERQAIFAAMGKPQPVEATWRGGETLDLGDGWYVEVHHTPGHSEGHLAIFDPRSRTLLSGDAVQGSMYPDLHGNPVLCPTYLQMKSYIATIGRLESMPIERLATCHWPLKQGPAVKEFLAESLAFVQRAEQLVLDRLRHSPQGCTLRELIAQIGPDLGRWPRSTDTELVYPLDGHLQSLVYAKKVIAMPNTAPLVFRLAAQ